METMNISCLCLILSQNSKIIKIKAGFAMSVLFILFCIFQIFFNSDYPRDEADMLEEISSNQNVVVINQVYHGSDWKNIFDIDISLKNDMRMRIVDCKRGENNDIVYERVRIVNGWRLYKAVYYEESGEYDCGFASDIEKRLMGNSLEYLLDNYQTLYDLYMNAPEPDFASCKTNKEIFDSIPDKGMFDVYDEENGKVIVVRKLYRVKSTNDELYNLGNSSDSEGRIFNEPVGSSIFRVKRKNELILIKFKTKSFRQDTPQELEQMQFHIANIPEVLKGLDFVFRAPLGRGEVYDINANGDKISLFSNTERSLREVNIVTYINDNEIDKILEFNLEQFDFPANGAERAYTPAMLWLTRRMNGIYEEWQKEQQEAGR